jgi:hypothetical protein
MNCLVLDAFAQTRPFATRTIQSVLDAEVAGRHSEPIRDQEETLTESTTQEAMIRLLRASCADTKGKIDTAGFLKLIEDEVKKFRPEERARLFISSAFLASVGRPLLDQQWLQTHGHPEEETGFHAFLVTTMNRELAPLSFLTDFFRSPRKVELESYEVRATLIVSSIATMTRAMTDRKDFHDFCRQALTEMQTLARLENEVLTRRKNSPEEVFLANSLYRAFDEMDRVLSLDYSLDDGMSTAPDQTERIFAGTGCGVQSSYASILAALDQVCLPPNGSFIDLGSGYGRVGFVIGFLRPDIQFIGYEYVHHRVQAAEDTARRAGISEHVHFIAQDLSDRNFRIPEADVYYMYDPFSQETYQYVFEQLREIGKRKSITVATKGRANDWFRDAVAGESWSLDATQDEGTMSLFRSRPVP